MSAPKVNFNTSNNTQTVPSIVSGVNFVLGRSIRGPFNQPNDIINSWPSFVRKYGGLMVGSDAPRLVKRLLEQGGSVRFARIGNYTDISDRSTLSASKPDNLVFEDAAMDPLFELESKFAGADYNNITVSTTAPSNGQDNYFNLNIVHKEDPNLKETYENLTIEGKPNVEKSNYLLDVMQRSQLVNVIYKDLSYIADDNIVPALTSKDFTGGTDGDDVTPSDYIGDSASRTGFHAFDEYDEAMQIGVFDNDDDSVHIAGAAYASQRKDLQYFIHLSNNLTTKTALIEKKDSFNIDTKFVDFTAGGLKLRDPLTDRVLDSSGIADLMILANKTEKEYGPYYSFSGNNRGLVSGALGVVNNFGSPANIKDLNDLANRRINMFINRDSQIKRWGNFSGQLKHDQERFTSIVRLVIFIKKSLKPIVEGFIEEPNEIQSWSRLHKTVKPFLDNLVTKRALYSYDWNGDQDATSMDNLTVNDPMDVTQGKYKVQLGIKGIPSIQEIDIDIILTPAGVDFEIASEIL